MLATRLRGLAVAAAVIALMAGCSAGQTATPADTNREPSAHPTATPAKPIDVAAAFMEIINDPAFTVSATLDGSMQLGTAVVTLTGEAKMRGQDSYLRVMADAPNAAPAEYEAIRIGSDAYERNDGGLWMHQAPGAPNTGGLVEGFDFTSLREAGRKRLDDATYTVLLPVGGTAITPGSLGFDDPSMRAFEGSLQFLADDTATPVAAILSGTWRQLVDAREVDASFDLTLRFARVGQWVKIQEPPFWDQWSSKELAYTMAIPAGWEASTRTDEEVGTFDLILGPVGDEIDVFRYTGYPADTTTGMWYLWAANWISEAYGVQPENWEDVLVAELPSRIYTVHAEVDGSSLLFIEAIVVGDGMVWDICWYSQAGGEESDRKLFQDFLSTFRPSA